MTAPSPSASDRRRAPRWVGPVLVLLVAAVALLLGLLGLSIVERRWEAQRPSMVLKPLPQWEPDNAVWGLNYPREYETYLKSRQTGTRTKFGGSVPRDYLEADPRLVILWSGYGFSQDYRQARGHYYSLTDVLATKRITPASPGTCMTCKSTDVPRLMARLGVAEFYATPFAEIAREAAHPIGCQDCHDPKTLNLRITRPALREAFAAMGRDIDRAAHQEMRSLVCAQCHVEYYFRDKTYLVFPWSDGLDVEAMLAYYERQDFADFTHAVSGTRLVKAQHPDYELSRSGVHAYRDVACADCHMPYRAEGGVKFTDHHVQSPLLAVATSCAVCHRWSEDEIRTRVETIQTKVRQAQDRAEDALVRAHFDVAAAKQAGAADADLAGPRGLIRRAQFLWDCVGSSNGMGFHAPQEATRLLGMAGDLAQEARVAAARLLAARGVTVPPRYPDVSTKEKAQAVSAEFVSGAPPALLP